MANLIETELFEPVYQLEISDAVLGGAGQIANSQAQALANRDAWLNANKANSSDVYTQLEIDAIESGLQSSIDDNASDINSAESSIISLDNRIDDLEDKTGWLSISAWTGTTSSFYGRVRQVGDVVIGQGYVIWIVGGYQDQPLMILPTGIGTSSIDIQFSTNGFGESNPLYVDANTRTVRLNRTFMQINEIHHFQFSYIV